MLLRWLSLPTTAGFRVGGLWIFAKAGSFLRVEAGQHASAFPWQHVFYQYEAPDYSHKAFGQHRATSNSFDAFVADRRMPVPLRISIRPILARYGATMKAKPTGYLLCGFIGAGKTTFARELERRTGAIRITKDVWFVQIIGNDPTIDGYADFDRRIRS